MISKVKKKTIAHTKSSSAYCLVPSAFTLIELLVVISIIGILIALSAVAFQSSRASARDAKRKADLETIRSALEMYKTDCVSYPSSPLANPLIGSGLPSACATANVYLSTVPQDPRPSLSYSYNPSPATSPTSYVLCAHLENGGTTAASGCPTGATACGEVCNYGVSSP